VEQIDTSLNKKNLPEINEEEDKARWSGSKKEEEQQS
jgi:hypothetical protein